MSLARAAGRLIIQRLVPGGFSNRYIMRAVRRQGFGYRTLEMNNDINMFSGRYKGEFYIAKLNPNEVVPKYLMNPGELGQTALYRVHYKTNYYAPDTDTYNTYNESMYTDDLAKKEDWSRINQERPKTPNSTYVNEEFVNSNVVSVDVQLSYYESLQ